MDEHPRTDIPFLFGIGDGIQLAIAVGTAICELKAVGMIV
jgi:hypothetical protein